VNDLLDNPDVLRASTLVHALLDRAERSPEEIFVHIGGRQDLALGPLADAVRRFAGMIEARGVRPGHRVLLALDNSLEFVVSWLGTWYAGAITVPVVPDAGLRVYRRAVELAQPALFVTGPVGEEKVRKAGANEASLLVFDQTGDRALAPELSSLLDQSDAATENRASGPAVAAVMFTSGTTGAPKGVCLSHLWFTWASRDVVRGMSYGPQDTLYSCLPLAHANAQDTTFGPALISGARVVFDQRFSASRFWRRLAETEATAFNLIGNMPRVLLNREADELVEHSATRAFAIPALPHYRHEFARRFGVELRQGYGSTEVGVPVFQDPDQPPDDSCGGPVPGTQLRVMGHDGLPAALGESGEICIWSSRPGSIASGYLGDPQRTAQAWRNGWFHTGDLGRLDGNGNLHFVGRAGDHLRRKGENFTAHEIEAAILEIDGIEDCSVVALPGDDGDDRIAAYIVVSAGTSIAAADVTAHCAVVVGKAGAPESVYQLPELPRTESGKIAKAVLIEQLTAGASGRAETQA